MTCFLKKLTFSKESLKGLIPPLMLDDCRVAMSWFRKPALEYIHEGWDFPLENQNMGWNSMNPIEIEKKRWEKFLLNLQGTKPIFVQHEANDRSQTNLDFHNRNMTYAYVLSLAAHNKSSVSVLDWGGSLGHYYQLGKTLFPDLHIDFHCKEVPLIVDLGKKCNPEVNWYSDLSCLARDYDLVMMIGVLPYYKNWVDILSQISKATKSYLFLGLMPLVNKGSGFVALQRWHGTLMLHAQFNSEALKNVLSDLNLCLIREFYTGIYPYVKNAPAQPELVSWLLKKNDE